MSSAAPPAVRPRWMLYVARYADLCAAGIRTEAGARAHWTRSGRHEGRVWDDAARLPDPAAPTPRVRQPAVYAAHLAGRRALEIGGPSALFGTPAAHGGVPAYALLAAVDFAAHPFWQGDPDVAGYRYDPRRPPGRQLIAEASALGAAGVADGAYDVVLASHVLEHVADPVRALREWLRVTGERGALLLVLPWKHGTFDHRRPTTTLAHLLEDERRAVGEDDLTHAGEAIALHDLARDPYGATAASFRERTLANPQNRMLHHHVFDLALLRAVLYGVLGLEIVTTDLVAAFHQVVLARKRAPLPPHIAPRPAPADPPRPDAADPPRSDAAGDPPADAADHNRHDDPSHPA